MNCKKCGSEDVICMKLDEKTATALSTLGLSPSLHHFDQYQCCSCGHVFQVRE